MKYNRHPGIDKDWSQITLGTWQLAPSEGWGDACSPKDAEVVVKNALDHGITAFDTAEGYGDGESERRLGKALGDKKDESIIVSKLWPDAEFNLKSFQERLDGTLKALDRDYVDLYLVHWPADHFNSKEKSSQLADIMSELKASGKAHAIGLSNFHLQDLKLFGDKLPFFSVNQVPYSLLKRFYEGETRDLCKANNIPYMAYGPTNKGLLARRFKKEDFNFPTRQNRPLFTEPLYSYAVKVFDVVEKIANEINCPPIQVSLAWVLAQQNMLTAIVGSRKPSQVKDFAESPSITLDKYQIAQLDNASDVFVRESQKADVSWD